MVIGSPGGSRIITITPEATANVIDHCAEHPGGDATDASTHQWLPDTVYIEPLACRRIPKSCLRAWATILIC